MVKYLMLFSVYTLAMIGIIVIAFLVWKNATIGSTSRKKGSIVVEESLSLNSRKTLHVIRINEERFLIAADVDKTTFLAKLGLNDDETLASANAANESFRGINWKNPAPGLDDISEEENFTPTSSMRNILKEFSRKQGEQ